MRCEVSYVRGFSKEKLVASTSPLTMSSMLVFAFGRAIVDSCSFALGRSSELRFLMHRNQGSRSGLTPRASARELISVLLSSFRRLQRVSPRGRPPTRLLLDEPRPMYIRRRKRGLSVFEAISVERSRASSHGSVRTHADEPDADVSSWYSDLSQLTFSAATRHPARSSRR